MLNEKEIQCTFLAWHFLCKSLALLIVSNKRFGIFKSFKEISFCCCCCSYHEWRVKLNHYCTPDYLFLFSFWTSRFPGKSFSHHFVFPTSNVSQFYVLFALNPELYPHNINITIKTNNNLVTEKPHLYFCLFSNNP